MNRREALASLAAVVGVVAVPHATQGHHYGPLTIERWYECHRHGIHLHVYHKGVDVTARCCFADDTPGRELAELYVVDAEGKKHRNAAWTGGQKEVVHGDIVIRPGARLTT